jgi:hypothetical protein
VTLANIPLAMDGPLTGAALVRKGFYAALRREGVIESDDFLVSADSPNGQSLRVAAGNAVVLNGYQSTPDEVYIVPNTSLTTIPSGSMPSSSPGTTYHMVCLVVGDPPYDQTGHPFMPSSFDTAQVNTFQYNRFVVLPCTAEDSRFSHLHKNYPGLALARLEIPGSTTTITPGMITDLRQMVVPTADEVIETGWQDFVLPANWASAETYGFVPPQYRRVGPGGAGGVLQLRGTAVRSVSASAAGATLTTLPSGYRPPAVVVVGTSHQLSATPWSAVNRVSITSAGAIQILGAVPAGGSISFDNVGDIPLDPI